MDGKALSKGICQPHASLPLIKGEMYIFSGTPGDTHLSFPSHMTHTHIISTMIIHLCFGENESLFHLIKKYAFSVARIRAVGMNYCFLATDTCLLCANPSDGAFYLLPLYLHKHTLRWGCQIYLREMLKL
jgi:hypothetical protein